MSKRRPHKAVTPMERAPWGAPFHKTIEEFARDAHTTHEAVAESLPRLKARGWLKELGPDLYVLMAPVNGAGRKSRKR